MSKARGPLSRTGRAGAHARKKMSLQNRPIILVVNDEPAVLELLTVLLEHESYKVLAASSGRRALELIASVEPDIVISDVVMPEMDGLELCRRLKREPRTESLPVLLMSAVRKTGEDNLEGLNAGADDYLDIPFRRQELLVKVARLTERHRVERHYREIVEQAADIIYTRDMQGRITSINEAGARFFNRPVSELVGLHLGSLLGDEAAAADIKETLKDDSGQPIRAVHCLKDAQGVPHYLEGLVTLMRDAEDQPTGVRCVVRDITERWLAQEALRESEKKFKAQYKNIPLPTYSWKKSGEDFLLADYNVAAVEMTKGHIAHSLGQKLSEYCSDRPDIIADFARCFAEQTVIKRETLFKLRSTGEEKLLDISYVFVPPDLVMCHTEDITERKRVKAELEASAAEMRALFSAMTDIILVLDAGGHYRKIAPTNPSLLYGPPQELLGKRLHDVFPADQADSFLESIRRALETGRPVNVEYDLTIQGNRLWFAGTVSPLPDDTVVWVARDITERKLAEEAMAQQAEREALINRISQAVRGSLETTEIFQAAVNELGSHLNVDRCSLFMKFEEAEVVRNVAAYHVPGVRPAGSHFEMTKVRDLLAGINQHGVLAFDDAAHDERITALYQHILRPAGVRSIMYVAINVAEEMPAAFALSTTQRLRSWSETDIALAKAVAIQTGIAIRQARLYQKAEATSAREALINRLSLAIRASLSLPEVLGTATRELGRAINASRVHLRLYDPSRPDHLAQVENEYVAPNAASMKRVDVNYDDPLGQRLQQVLQPIVIDDALTCAIGAPDFNSYVRLHAMRSGIRSQINCPLVVNGSFRGALCIHQTDRVRRWTEDEVELVQAVAAQLATGIAQAELFEMTKRAKKEWETTFNAMSDGIFIFDNSGELVRANRAGAAMEDTWPHLLAGRHCCDILRVNDDDEACIVEKTIADGRSVTLEIMPERYNRPLLVTVEPVFESEGQMVGAVCTARDLSELRKVEAMAREHQSLLTNILESVRDPICALDREGNFLWLNTASTVMSGYRTEDLIGHAFLEILHPSDREMAEENFRNALEGQTCSYEVRYLTRGGDVRDALFYNAPLVIEGRTTGVLGIARDITEHKQQQKRAAQADKLRALGQLASGVAHDFNNALAAILGRAQLMRRQVHTGALMRNLEIIQTAAEDAAATVRRIQTFARKSQDQEFELLDAHDLLHDAVEITRTRWENEARMRGLHYDVSVQATEGLYTSGNASELREVFVNLIVNAVDAMPQDGRLLISGAQEGERLSLRFADTGVGMTEDVRERIFEPFYTTKGANGTGLGLAVSYSIINSHGGQINVESEEGRGTTFLIDLPAAVPTSVSTRPQQSQAQVQSFSIMVIDDEPFVRETLADMLLALGHQVTVAAGGREALESLADAAAIELVFTDLSMPEMDGLEVAREIRRRWPLMNIVLVTGYGKGTEGIDGDRDLFNGIIAKPFDFSQIMETITKATQGAVTSDK
jgi:PAS domain S-box-containing protein